MKILTKGSQEIIRERIVNILFNEMLDKYNIETLCDMVDIAYEIFGHEETMKIIDEAKLKYKKEQNNS